MKEVAKTVFYCDYCRKHGLSRASMAKHEAGCTMNPDRVCRWRIDGHSDGTKQMDMEPLAAALASRAILTRQNFTEVTLLSQADIDWLRAEVDGCPACMLAALRQSNVTDIHWNAQSNLIFDYQTEVERLRAEEREADERATLADLW